VSSVYELLVREYLEFVHDYFVRQDVKFRKSRGYGDIDIVAVQLESGKVVDALVGEVKSWSLNRKVIDEIEERFNDEGFQERLKELGLVNPRKFIFCWATTSEIKEYASQKGITVIDFSDIVDELREKVKELRKEGRWFHDVHYPITTLIQLIFHSYLREVKGEKGQEQVRGA